MGSGRVDQIVADGSRGNERNEIELEQVVAGVGWMAIELKQFCWTVGLEGRQPPDRLAISLGGIGPTPAGVITARRVADGGILIDLVVRSMIGWLAREELSTTGAAATLGLVMLGRRSGRDEGRGVRTIVFGRRRSRHDLTGNKRERGYAALRWAARTGGVQVGKSKGSKNGVSDDRWIVENDHAAPEIFPTVGIVAVAAFGSCVDEWIDRRMR
ncbi:hypothetical protein FRC09_018548 [Ceratobasidium sp. 395]|nr:hypothetical protein FRC09_018548 [Ceratobasidium sp. 395]